MVEFRKWGVIGFFFEVDFKLVYDLFLVIVYLKGRILVGWMFFLIFILYLFFLYISFKVFRFVFVFKILMGSFVSEFVEEKVC